MNALKQGWFSELSPPEITQDWNGQCLSLQVEEILVNKKSDFQEVLVFKSKSHGNVLVLDGIIQCTEFDEFAYHEMLAHLPLFAHSNPKQVLIIGGGDGGVVREVLKHESVERVVLCEIDPVVVEVSRQHLPTISCALNNPRLDLQITDGIEYLKCHQQEFDVIITDSSDPIGPAKNLYEREFYSLLKSALRPNGIVASQGECPWIDLTLISELFNLDPDNQLETPKRVDQEALNRMNLKFYNFDFHKAVFSLPNFVQQALQ
ncbi:PABS domain-containing protein [Aphelenchoides bicaudatus]|nr:PABS domain-containing protein [Aphelenchoides bicaudatus]